MAAIHLRPIKLADAAPLFALIKKNVHRLPPKFSDLESLEASIHGQGSGRDLRFGIWAGPGVIGVVNVMASNGPNPEIGYWIDEDFEGQGITTAAVKAVLGELPYSEWIAKTLVANGASQRVLLKAGFRPDGADPANPSYHLFRYIRSPG